MKRFWCVGFPLLMTLSLLGGMALVPRVAHGMGDEAGRRATDEFNRGLTMMRGGDINGLAVAKKAFADIEAALGSDHPTTKQASAALLMARFQVRSVKLKLAIENTTPTGPKMTSVWAITLARKHKQAGEDALKSGDKTGIKQLEQAYLYVLFGVRDPLSKIVAEYSGTLSTAYRNLGQEARAEGIEDGDVPPGLIPQILLSMDMKTLYEQADAAANKRDWQAAAANQEKLVALLERELGRDAEELIKWYSDLALYYGAAGRVDEAEVILARAEKLVMTHYGATSAQAREFYQQVASHFMFRGDVARANLYRQKGWELARKAPSKDPSVLRDLIAYADTMVSRRQLDVASKIIAEVEGRIKTIGEVGADVRLRLVCVQVALLDEQGKPAEASKRIAEVESLASSIDDRASTFLFHRTAAEHSQKAGEFPTAARHFLQAGEVGSVVEAVTSGMFENAAMMYWAAGRNDDAVAAADRAGAAMDDHLPTLLVSGTDSEKRQQLLFASLQNHALVSLSIDGFPRNGPAAEVALRTLVRRKAVVLDALTRTGEVVRAQDSESGKHLLEQQQQLRERLASVVYHPAPDQYYDQTELQGLLTEIDAVERGLAKQAQGTTPAKPVTLDELRAALPDNGVLIEFAVYRPHDPKLSGKDQKAGLRYAAFVLPKSGPVVAVPLRSVEEIDGRVATLRKSLATPKGKYKDPARGLYDAIMADIIPHLGGAKHLVIAPASQLNLVPFAALQDGDGKFLLDRFTMTYVASGRDLKRSNSEMASLSQPVLVGAPAFDEPGDGAQAPAGSKKALKFSKLPGTAQEIEALQQVVPHAEIVTGTEATEPKLKGLDRPVILHVATHGFFLAEKAEALAGSRALVFDAGTSESSETAEAEPSWAVPENPLLRSGVALAGANTRVGGDDGILTALEVASMDLRGTELVVLSACETGVGDVEAGEGVYGLRRALSIAGTKSQVMSLWKVDDTATRDLMVAFYQQLKKGKQRGDALREAQAAIRKQDGHTHPYYWAAFIPSGAWGTMALEPGRPSSTSNSPSKSRGRVRDYWRNPPRDPILYIGGSYSAPISVDPHNGQTVSQRHGFGVDLLVNVAPRWIAGLSYYRSMWDIGADGSSTASESKVASLEVVVGVDALGMPRDWRVRPSLNAWVGGGLAWTKDSELIDGGNTERAIGLAGTFGGDAQLHIRFTDRMDMRLGGGITKSGYFLNDRTIAGAAKYPGAWRWMVGGAFGFIF